MMETLYTADSALFVAINQSLANPVTDFVMPWITNDIFLRVVFVGIIASLLIRGPARLRWAALGALIAVGVADQLSSAALKPLIGRLRPCQSPELSQFINLLVNCGSGKAMPSSHAANTFAVSTFLACALVSSSQQASKRHLTRFALFAFATLVSLSRVIVGVHYPADVLIGAALGALIGLLVALGFRRIQRLF